MGMDEIDRALRPALVNAATVAAITGLSMSGVYAGTLRGDIESTKVGGKLLIFSGPLRAKFKLPPVKAVAA